MKVSVKSFVSFLKASGRSKVGVVAQCREKYKVEQDFYKRLREAFNKLASSANLSDLPAADQLTANSSKLKNFGHILYSFEAFEAENEIEILPVAKGQWHANDDLFVSVSAPLRLKFNGVKCVVMLWFEASEPKKFDVESFSALMSLSYKSMFSDHRFGLFDVRRRKIHFFDADKWFHQSLLGESVAFQSIWDALDSDDAA